MAQAGSRAAGAQSTPAATQTQSNPTPATPADAARVKELEAEVAQLREQTGDADRVKELEAENAWLREQLATAGSPAPAAKPTEPSFTFTEGQREELARTGRTVSPFTGKRYVGSSPENAREATAEEFAKAKPAKPAEK